MASLQVGLLVFISVIEGLISLIGPFLNGIVSYTFYKNPQLLCPQNIFIVTISLVDFFMSLIPIPLAVIANVLGQWPFGIDGCVVHAFLVFQFGLLTITHLTAATVEKYLTITKSRNNSPFFSKRQTLVVIAGLWAYTLTFSICPLVGISRFGYEGINTSCSIIWNTNSTKDYIYFSFLFMGCFIIPVILLCCLNCRVLGVMKHMRLEVFELHGQDSNVARSFYRREKRALFRLGLMVIAFLVAWSPYAVVSLATIINKSSPMYPGINSLTAVFAKTSCILNSVVLLFCFKRLRKLAVRSLPFCKRSNAVASSST